MPTPPGWWRGEKEDNMKGEVKEFTGVLKFTSPMAKCGPLHIYGHWVLKDNGGPFLVWCNDGLYKNGINANYCEVERIDIPTR